MAVALRATATPTHAQAINTGNGARIALPAGILGGDLILIRVAFNNSSVLSVPSGYTQLHTQLKSTLTLTTFWKLAAGTFGSASSDASATVLGGMTNNGSAYAMTAEVYSGVDQTAPINTHAIAAESATTTAHVTPTVTTTVDQCWVSEAACDKGAPASTSETMGSGLTSRSVAIGTGTASSSLGVGDSNAGVSTGTAGGHTITGTLSTATAVMSTVALAPAAGAAVGAASMSSATALTGAADGPPSASMSSGTALTGAASIVAAPTLDYLTAGGPTSSGFTVVAARPTGVTSLSLAVSLSSSMSSPTTFGPVTADGDGFYRFTASGLTANTNYFYQLSDSVFGRFGPVTGVWTTPTPGARVSFDLTLGACVDNAASDGSGLAAAVARAARLNFFTGDQSYRSSTSTTRTVHEAQIMDQVAAVPSYPAYTRQMLLSLNSDHDAGPDNGPSNLTDAPYMRASIDAATHYSANPLADTRSPLVGRYFTMVYGAVKFIFIDVRNTDRSTVTATGTSTDTMLGATQKAWLKAELITAEPYKVIVCDTAWMGADDNTGGLPVKGDWWPAYPHERTELINYIAAHPEIGQLELWHGDSHLIGYATAAKNTWGNFPVLCAAGFNETGGGRDTSTFSAFWNNSSGPVRQYGYITFVDDGSTITRTFTGYDASSGTDVSRVSSTQSMSTPNATMTSGSALAGGATRTQPATAAMSSGSALTGSGSRLQPATAGMSSGTALTGSAAATLAATAVMASGSALAGTATAARPVIAGMTSATALAGSLTATLAATSAMSSGTALTGASTATVGASAGMSSGTVLGGAPSATLPAAAAMASGTALAGTVTAARPASAAMASGTALTGATAAQLGAAATMTSGTSFVAAASRAQPATAAMTSATALAGAANRQQPATTVMASGTALAGVVTRVQATAATMASATALTGTATRQQGASTGMASATQLTGTASGLLAAGTVMASGTALAGAVSRSQPAAAAMASASALGGAPSAEVAGSSAMSSASSLTGFAGGQSGVSAMSTGSALTGAGTASVAQTAVMVSASALVGAAARTQAAAAAMQSASGMTGAVTRATAAVGAMSSATVLGGSPVQVSPTTAVMASGSALSGAAGGQPGASVMVSQTILSGSAQAGLPAIAAMLSGTMFGGQAVRTQPSAASMSSGTALTGAVLVTVPGGALMASASSLTSTAARRDLTLTYTVGADRWTATVGTDRWAASTSSDRWTARSTPV